MRDYISEAEAAKRWCPLARVVSYTADPVMVVAANRAAKETPVCLGGACMAWRWSHQDTGPSDPPTGYCGAFGVPQLRGG
jgi:hypothetical protein